VTGSTATRFPDRDAVTPPAALGSAASANPASEPHDARTETQAREAAERAKEDTEARQVAVTIEAKRGWESTHQITVSTPITYPVKQVEAQIAWQTNGGLAMTSTGFGGDPPRADGQHRCYTFRASVNPQIRNPEPVIRFVDLHGNRYYQFRDHTQRFPANTDWTQAVTAIDRWLRTGPSLD